MISAVRKWLTQSSQENSSTKKPSNKTIKYLKMSKSSEDKEFKYSGQRSTLLGEFKSKFDEEMIIAGYAENGILKAISFLVSRG